jgi:hypothetical protein
MAQPEECTMAIRNVLGAFAVTALVSGCGGADFAKSGASYASPTTATADYSGGYNASPSVESTNSTPREASAKPSYDDSRTPSHTEALNQAPERPGLGTGWGENRESHVHQVDFQRDASTPFATGMLHYNDIHGVQALASFHQAMSGGYIHDVPEAGGAITVSIVGENGSPLDALKVGDRTYVVGRDGERYSIVLTNHTNHRFESVASVDGLDVVNGHPASLDNRGYILSPFARLEIDGFRRSNEAVAAFRFSRVSDSYAAQTSGDRNVGVVGVAFFSERGDSFTPWTFDELRTRDTAQPFPVDLRYAQPPR